VALKEGLRWITFPMADGASPIHRSATLLALTGFRIFETPKRQEIRRVYAITCVLNLSRMA
jgi:hypothetical protein